jgi:hypothetical protein
MSLEQLAGCVLLIILAIILTKGTF